MNCEVQKWKKYNVKFLLHFTKSLSSGASEISRIMTVPESEVEALSAKVLELELQRSIARLNEFPPEEVEVTVTAFSEA